MTVSQSWCPAADLTLVLDLGTFVVETDAYKASQLNAEEAALYECLSLEGRDIAAYVVDGAFSFSGLQNRLQDTEDGSALDLAQVCSSVVFSGSFVIDERWSSVRLPSLGVVCCY